ncbi:MAG: zinc ribbon domain-containing protein [Ruminococcaceae bacterium]|nr:zinc ribbon domain-containing protein [Oscillospiraceae bacterium]
MPYCNKCGTEVKEVDKFCRKCGAPLKVAVPNTCEKCGSPLKDGDKFCWKCGNSINGSTNNNDLHTSLTSNTAASTTNEDNSSHEDNKAHKLTNICLNCGDVLADDIINCNKCGYHVDTVRCPVCREATNPLNAKCINCGSNIAELVKADLDKSAAVLKVLLATNSFDKSGINYPSDQMIRLARQNSIVGLAAVYACEAASKKGGSFESFSLFIYDESSPDDWDKTDHLIYNPREHYASKQEYIEAIRKDSKRPDFGFFAWAITYARSGKDIYAYQLCMLLSNLYRSLGDVFDNHGPIISPCGVELMQQAYNLMLSAQINPALDYSKDDFAKKLFADVRYKVARHYFTIEQFGFNNSADKESEGIKYYLAYNNGYGRALNVLQPPVPEEQTRTKLLRGLMYYAHNNYQELVRTWNDACKDSTYLNSEKDVMDEGIFLRSAICMSTIARLDGNINAAIDILKFSSAYITRNMWNDELKVVFSRYKQDRYGNIVYVE